MKKLSIDIVIALVLTTLIFSQCNDNENKSAANQEQKDTAAAVKNYGGFESQAKWGEHLVMIAIHQKK